MRQIVEKTLAERDAERKIYISFFVFTLCLLFYCFLSAPRVGIDATFFIEPAINLLSGKGLSFYDIETDSYAPYVQYPPIYPLLLAGFFKAFGVGATQYNLFVTMIYVLKTFLILRAIISYLAYVRYSWLFGVFIYTFSFSPRTVDVGPDDLSISLLLLSGLFLTKKGSKLFYYSAFWICGINALITPVVFLFNVAFLFFLDIYYLDRKFNLSILKKLYFPSFLFLCLPFAFFLITVAFFYPDYLNAITDGYATRLASKDGLGAYFPNPVQLVAHRISVAGNAIFWIYISSFVFMLIFCFVFLWKLYAFRRDRLLIVGTFFLIMMTLIYVSSFRLVLKIANLHNGITVLSLALLITSSFRKYEKSLFPVLAFFLVVSVIHAVPFLRDVIQRGINDRNYMYAKDNLENLIDKKTRVLAVSPHTYFLAKLISDDAVYYHHIKFKIDGVKRSDEFLFETISEKYKYILVSIDWNVEEPVFSLINKSYVKDASASPVVLESAIKSRFWHLIFRPHETWCFDLYVKKQE